MWSRSGALGKDSFTCKLTRRCVLFTSVVFVCLVLCTSLVSMWLFTGAVLSTETPQRAVLSEKPILCNNNSQVSLSQVGDSQVSYSQVFDSQLLLSEDFSWVTNMAADSKNMNERIQMKASLVAHFRELRANLKDTHCPEATPSQQPSADSRSANGQSDNSQPNADGSMHETDCEIAQLRRFFITNENEEEFERSVRQRFGRKKLGLFWMYSLEGTGHHLWQQLIESLSSKSPLANPSGVGFLSNNRKARIKKDDKHKRKRKQSDRRSLAADSMDGDQQMSDQRTKDTSDKNKAPIVGSVVTVRSSANANYSNGRIDRRMPAKTRWNSATSERWVYGEITGLKWTPLGEALKLCYFSAPISSVMKRYYNEEHVDFRHAMNQMAPTNKKSTVPQMQKKVLKAVERELAVWSEGNGQPMSARAKASMDTFMNGSMCEWLSVLLTSHLRQAFDSRTLMVHPFSSLPSTGLSIFRIPDLQIASDLFYKLHGVDLKLIVHKRRIADLLVSVCVNRFKIEVCDKRQRLYYLSLFHMNENLLNAVDFSQWLLIDMNDFLGSDQVVGDRLYVPKDSGKLNGKPKKRLDAYSEMLADYLHIDAKAFDKILQKSFHGSHSTEAEKWERLKKAYMKSLEYSESQWTQKQRMIEYVFGTDYERWPVFHSTRFVTYPSDYWLLKQFVGW